MNWKRREFLRCTAFTGAAVFLPGTIRQAVAGDLPPLRVIFYTDVHCRPGLSDPAVLERAAARISRMPHDLVMAGGDVIHAGHISRVDECRARFALYRSFLENLPPGVEHVVGNHDLAGARPGDGSPPAEDPWQLWREELGCASANRAFTRAGYRFVIFDTLRILPQGPVYEAVPSPASLAWLDAEIAAIPADQPVILCTHVPFLSDLALSKAQPGEPPPPTLQVPNAATLVEKFRAHRLVAILQGHVHVNERMTLSGIPVFSGGAISGAWWKGNVANTPPGFASLEIANGEITWTYHSLIG